ncbi:MULTISPECIES: hypothetical protein [Variovorax]|jgi:hypothetical protein|uniref:hypothetical protein n=1 Tax=Variovorax TaxID=34072 RepID=UPI00089C1990|nr:MULTISPECIES: hypothetical protein [Variovorax]MDQ0082424.1 hypothetical protein [Variovorax boronicumulans]SDZ34497.1 hypothetical protein SAMN05518854_105187 [Variovorax sp. YR266]SES79915.1 hypothetical protein SAMN05443580_101341 [Variovorax sp. OV084]SOD27589.1 hypothetical protein SAMN05518800_3150 [Variovorax sp. YR752]
MKLLLSIAFAAVALAGCASAPTTPTEPGTGRGTSYVPMVAMEGVDKVRYDNDVAECRTASNRITARSETGDAMWGALGVGLITVYGQGIVAAASYTGITAAVIDWNGRPDSELIAEHQQIAIVHCMAKRGYRNLDPNVRDSFYGNTFDPGVVMKPRRTGVDTYNVETLAKAGRCNLQPRAELTAKGPGYETYNVPCDNGGTWAVRCEFGKCRVLAQALIRRS